jgi:transcriptional regulator with XRE-family HTH domain
MPTRLATARKARGWTQDQLLRAVRRQARLDGRELPSDASLRVTLSRWENGRHQPGPLYQRLLAEVLEVTEADLGFAPVRRLSRPLPLPAGSDLVAYLDAVLVQHIEADRLIGSCYLIGVVGEQLKIIELCLGGTRSTARPDFLRLGNRYAEFCGWLNQDQGRYPEAEAWTRKALDFAQALDDPHLVSYTLMRRSNIASDAGHAHEALTLAEAALRQRPLTSGLRAVALRQKAAAHALLGDQQAYRQAVDDGLSCAFQDDALSLMTGYCTVAYMKMEAGAAAMELQQPRVATQLLTDADEGWPDGHERDHALCLARLAYAQACAHDPDQACSTGHRAVEAAALAPSARTTRTLRALGGALNRYRTQPDVADLRQILSEAS